MSSHLEKQYYRNKFRRWALVVAAACSFSGFSISVTASDLWVETFYAEVEPSEAITASKTLEFKRKPQAIRIELEPITSKANEKSSTSSSSSTPWSAPLQIGNGRTIPQTQSSESFGRLLEWEPMPDGGQVAAVEFISPDAVGTRIILEIKKLDPRVQFVFSGSDLSSEVTLTGFDVLDSIYRDNPGSSDALVARLFTSPFINGESILLEIIVPNGVSPQELQIAVPSLSHIVVSPVESNPWLKNVGSSGSCNIDSTCRPEWEPVSRGVARMLFSNPATGNSFLCTGSLLNDTQSSATPYFLTANHCLSTQPVASTLQTFWFYHSTSCNSGTLNPSRQIRTGGATLLFTQGATDTTLLRLNEAPPTGVNFLGWTTAIPNLGQALGGVHHPEGDTAKVSLANLTRHATCTETQCISSSSPNNTTYLGVNWTSGVVEPGSSGSGLFWPNSGQQYLVGQLLGGNSSCSNPAGADFYGRFDLAYQAGMREWLDAAPVEPEPTNPVIPSDNSRTPVYRFYNNASNAHFFTASAAERDYVVAQFSSFVYEGIAFYAHPSSGTGLSPVYRFYNEATGSHFYTISQDERDGVIERFPSYIYEGVAWNARTSPGDASQPLYRFYNTATRSHFYTMSAAERDFIIERFATYIYEGVGYHTWVAP